jgi:hypothetical protein
VRALSVAGARTIHEVCQNLITGWLTSTFANAIGVNGCPASPGDSSDSRALLPAGYTAYQGPCTRASSSSQLVAMLLPETSPMFMAVANTAVMGVISVAVPMPEIPACARGGRHCK